MTPLIAQPGDPILMGDRLVARWAVRKEFPGGQFLRLMVPRRMAPDYYGPTTASAMIKGQPVSVDVFDIYPVFNRPGFRVWEASQLRTEDIELAFGADPMFTLDVDGRTTSAVKMSAAYETVLADLSQKFPDGSPVTSAVNSVLHYWKRVAEGEVR